MLVVYCCLFFVKKKCLYFIRVCFAILCCIHYLQISPQMQLSHVNNMRDRYFEELMDKHLVGESISTAVIKTQSLTYCYILVRSYDGDLYCSTYPLSLLLDWCSVFLSLWDIILCKELHPLHLLKGTVSRDFRSFLRFKKSIWAPCER